MTDISDLSAGFRTGDWLVYPARRVLVHDDEETTPEPLVFDLLMKLASRNGDIVSKDELIEKIWNNRPMADESLNRCVYQLRKALGDTRPYRYIETLPRRGYRLKTPVEPLQTRDASGEASVTPVSIETTVAPRRQGWLLPALGAAVLGFVVWISWQTPPPPPDMMIGVLPFENLSAAEGNDYLVGGFKEELVSTLHSLPGLSIVNSRLPYDDLETTEIAEKLGVSIVLQGSVQRAGESLKISFVMSDGADGAVVVSEVIEGKVESLFELQSQLALSVRGHVLGETGQEPITRRKPTSFRAYDTYMRGLYAFDRRPTATSLDDAIALFKETIDLDPAFGPAYLKLATSYTLLPTYRSISMSEASELALSALDRGTDVDPTIADAASAVRGFFHHMDMDWLSAEADYRRAVDADIVDPTSLLWYSRMLASVGRLDDSLEMASRAREMDPTSAMVTGRVAMAYTWIGDYDNANNFFERANALGAGGQTYLLAYALCLYQRGEIDKSWSVTAGAFEAADIDAAWISPLFAAFENPELAGEALQTLDESVESGTLPIQVALVGRVLLGDIETAFRIASRLADEGEIFEMDLLFIPQSKPLREYEGFDELMSEVGLATYWQQKQCTWQGQSFACKS
ncbi:MAG: winged helix-turn-helix domain-containing protein [Woeseiaceae bacterium]|nr:winged helix-turn-helix domain-containing protein [Woeseiaceae bacterium]